MPFIVPFFPPILAQELTVQVLPVSRSQGVVIRSSANGVGPVGSQGQPLMNMDQALPSLSWKVSERGPLMVVGANKINVPDLQERMQKQALPVIPPANTQAKTIADLFEYRVEKVGTLHALIPIQIKKFDGAPNIDPSEAMLMERHELAQALGYSLTKDQWAALSSANGLGVNDLTPKQQAMYLELLPDPVRIRPTQRPDNQQGQPEAVELTPDQRAQMRLRMSRQLSLAFMASGSGNNSVSFGDGLGQKERNFYLEYVSARKEPLYDRVAPLVPNRLKPSDLDFNAAQLDPHVTFDGIQTVEPLMERLRQTTGARVVLADARLGGQTVKFWGESARAGDVLQALCRCVGGTFRKVGTGQEAFYVLTDDRVGLGTRLAAFGEWRNTASSQRWRNNEKLRKTMESLDIRSMASLEDPYGLSPEQRDLVEKSRYNFSGSQQDRGLSISSLPASMQAYVQKTLDKTPTFRFNDGTGEQEQSLRKDRVMIHSNYKLQFVVPGWGEADSHDLWGIANAAEESDSARHYRNNPTKPPTPAEVKPLAYPASWRVRALSIRPKDAAEAKALTRLAKANGFTTIWVTVPPDAAKARPLIEAAQAEKLPVVAVTSLLQVPRSAIPTGTEPDISIMGETSDQYAERQRLRAVAMNPDYPVPAPTDPPVYLAPTAATQKIMIERAAAIAKIPGLAALVMRNITPPGYGEPAPYYSTERAGLGFTLDNRLAFLQKESVDPIDLSTQYMDSRLLPRFFDNNGPNHIQLLGGQYGPDPNWKDRQRLWGEFLSGRITSFKKALFTRLKEVSPALPLWVSPNEVNNAENFVSLWEKPEAKLAKNASPWDPRTQLSLARGFSSTALTQLSPIWRDNKKKLMVTEWRTSMAEQIKQASPAGSTGGWAGFYIDMTSLSAEDITEMLPYYKISAP